MNQKQENPLKVLFSFAGEAKGRMTLSVLLALVGELFGMAPYFAVALLAKQIYAGTATVAGAGLIAGAAAVCMCLRAVLTGVSSLRSHDISFTILKNIRCAIAEKMARVPMGVMLETPSGTFKTLLVDNVGRLEDIIAHMVPEFVSNLSAPLLSIVLACAYPAVHSPCRKIPAPRYLTGRMTPPDQGRYRPLFQCQAREAI